MKIDEEDRSIHQQIFMHTYVIHSSSGLPTYKISQVNLFYRNT